LGGFSVSSHRPVTSPISPTPFAGYSEITIDDKGRLSIPAKFRAVVVPVRAEVEAGSQVSPTTTASPAAYYVMPWGDSLVIVTEQRFKELAATATGGAPVRPTADGKTISPQRFFMLSERLEPDGAGRVTLPKELMSRVKMQGEMVIYSGGTYLQVMPAATAKKLIDEVYDEDT
jgi:DNA-binding transcriptional regulator/RsmH inhibitor MraZ